MSAYPPFDMQGLEMFSQADPGMVPPSMRRALPRTSMMVNGNNGLTQNVAAGSSQPPTLEQAMAEVNRQRMESRKRYNESRDKPVDLAEMQEYAKTRSREGQGATLAAIAADFAGPRFANVQESLLKKSMAAQDPMRVGKGFLTPDGRMIVDPYAKQEQNAQDMRDEVEFYEKQYNTLVAAADKAQDRRETRQEREARAESDRQLRRDLAAGGGGLGAGTAMQIGSGLNQEPIFRQRNGSLFTYDNYGQPVTYAGPVNPKAGSAQPTEDERKAAGWFVQADNARKNMEKAIARDPAAALPTVAERAAGMVPFIGNDLANSRRPEDRQMFVQAGSSMAEALLRAATGAGMNQYEADQKVRELVPQLGDKAGTIKQKIEAYDVYMNALKTRAGRALPAGGMPQPAPSGGNDPVIDLTPPRR